MLGDQEYRSQIDCDDAVPFFLGHRHDSAVNLKSSAVKQSRDLSQACGLFSNFFALGRFRDVGRLNMNAIRGKRREALRVDIHCDDLAAALREMKRRGPPDTGGSPCDNELS